MHDALLPTDAYVQAIPGPAETGVGEMNKQATNRLVIIRYQERGKIKFHTAGAGRDDTEQSIREWFRQCKPRAEVLQVVFEETN